MKIYIDKIPEEGIRIESSESAGIIGYRDEWAEFKEPVLVSVFAQKIGDTLLINGTLKTDAAMKCARCLKNFSQKLETKEFNYNKDVKGLEEVDITGEICEEVLLLLPIKPLCSKNCKGICPKCGQSLNEKKCSCKTEKEDIKWLGLDKLKFKTI